MLPESLFTQIKRAGDFIRAGSLVVFPTETVYGLGADAFNAEAVSRIYSAKGRPGDNPLILHVASREDFSRLAHEPPDYAHALIEKFWPGPLTLVVRKKADLPAWLGGHPNGVTETIGIRMPAHPVASALIRAADCIIAAPSANKAGKPSPTSLAHVLEDFCEAERGGIFFLEGENADVGLESTVVDVTGEMPVILRPGGVTAEEIFEVASILQNSVGECHSPTQFETPPRSPGMKYKHYAPRAEMTVLSGEPQKIATHIFEAGLESGAEKIGALISAETQAHLPHPTPPNVKILPLGVGAGSDPIDDILTNRNFFQKSSEVSVREQPPARNESELLSFHEYKKIIAQNFFANLREFDKLNVNIIFAEAVCENGIGAAIMDRMRKAADGRIIDLS
ncbi:MAG: L-threonylcarbamoyladenylate synthase [Defluviitaleaceae bacterium]|nr:L-threonylcarbamoyladenylate synthase [Defluviitaleaceae bacterium]